MIALISFTSFAFAGGDQNQTRYDGAIGEGPTQQQRIANPNEDALQVRQLTPDQKLALYSIYEEEKVARDVYITLGEKYSEENTFANIQWSEQNHMDAVRNLCVKYGIDIPDVDAGVGVFELPGMAGLYDSFVAQGTLSLLDALGVGQEIEIMDIEDLGGALEGMPADVQRVLLNLISGSNNHWEAFTTALERETAQ